jgi:quinol monooxygenase YgiN
VSVTRLNHFHARQETVDALRQQLQAVVTQVRASDGCESVQLLRGTEDPTRFFVIEVWASVEAHQASFKNATPEQIQAVMALLAEPPSGYYLEVIA